jgi:hypothetical protein
MKKFQSCLAVVCCSLLLVLSAAAQVQNGQFSGTVTDPSGAAVAGAKVTVSNAATNVTATQVTNGSGAYTIKELPPGTYSVSVEASGFRTFTNKGVTINAGTISRVDAKLQVGQAKEVVEVSGEASIVNTDDSKLAITVGSTQIENLPLNGRNVYDLMQMAPGAVNVAGVDMENGHNTVVNGLREDFNGFLINGVANKGLSGGVNNVPIEDTVQEFQQLQLNTSAQYGNSAGANNNLVTKSGTNSFHGSAWEYVRNDAFDSNDFFANNIANDPDPRNDPNCDQAGKPRCKAFHPPLRFNQFGGTIGGPIVKDKVFFFGAYQGDRFTTAAPPIPITVESPQWRQAVTAAQPNSVASLLYQNFTPGTAGSPLQTLDQYAGLDPTTSTPANYTGWLCPDNNSPAIAARIASVIGVTAQDQTDLAAASCSTILPIQPGTMNRSLPFINSGTAIFNTQTQTIGNLFNGNEATAKLDYDWNASNRMFINFAWNHLTDTFGPCDAACTRGFTNPQREYFPNGQINYVHTFSPTVLNEVHIGYTQNNLGISTSKPGVPSIYFDDGTAGFGSYSGYPQVFKEHDYSYGDMISITHSNHNIKVGVDFKRNIENSEFNVARPSYEMFDPLYFAADAPAEEVAGVDPGFVSNTPAHLSDNIRHWRNLEFGTYVQDDWKATKRLTLNLGLRYDIFTRHTEENNLATTFLLGPGPGIVQQLESANSLGVLAGGTCAPANPSTAILAGVCGPGGFAPSKSLGKGDHNDFGPRVGFAWDVFGNGKTSMRGGFGISYESTLYNPLSNSRWNPPYYSFNLATGFLNGGTDTIIYGPTTCTSSSCSASGAVPTFTGPPTNPGQGPSNQQQATGNITGWASFNPDAANLTGIILPQGIRDPYVYNFFYSIQHEIAPKTVLEVDYVGTASHKLFRAQDINRAPGALLPIGATTTDNLGRTLIGLGGRPNQNYATLRNWQNAVNGNYHGLQVQVKKAVSHGLLFNAGYTYSHSIDEGSTWHSGATTASGGAGGDGYSTDQLLPGLDRGNSVYDIRHRLTFNYVYALPGANMHGFMGAVLGGWQYSGIWAFQSGAHWSPYASNSSHLSAGCSAVPFVAANCTNTGGDFNLDGGKNDRPDSSIENFNFNRNVWANGWCSDGFAFGSACGAPNQSGLPLLTAPCLGCVGTLGRNTFLGPGQWFADMTLGKVFKLTEKANLKFEWQAFNVLNRTNFLLATSGGAAANHVSFTNFGQAGGTLNPREMQFDLKLSF